VSVALAPVRAGPAHTLIGALAFLPFVAFGLMSLPRWWRQQPGRILRVGAAGTGSWGNNVLSWLRPPAPHRIVLRYEDLIRDPRAAVTPIIATLTPAFAVRPNTAIPSLDELRRHDDRFFRRGRTGSHHDELPADLHQLFWSRADSRAAMTLLGYPKPDDEG
jgi:hypothetical protein